MSQFKEPVYSQLYIDTGKGKPVILLHGLFGNVTMWRSTINVLKNHCRVIVPRLPLFEVPVHRANLNYLVEVFHEFLDWYQLTDVTLIGTDLGGQLALHYAYAYPDRVRSVVISGSSGLSENLPAFNNERSLDYDTVKNHVHDAFYNDDAVGSAIVKKVYKTINSFVRGLKISSFTKASQNDTLGSLLYRINTPVLMIWGLQDKITPPTVALHFHDLLKHGTLKFISACGHLPMVEQAVEYNNAVAEFLKDKAFHFSETTSH